ncbi:MAG: hypothetical protein HGB11_07115, partial [Chlorobiales bacterium]|nr:hypothetical protein [Chlorobiales bacterium]
MKRIAVFGCKHTTLFMVNALRQKTEVSKVITISPSQGEKADVADYCDMEKYCRENAISSYVANKYTLKDEADQKQIANMKLDVGFVIGWQRLVPPEVLNSFSIGVFGMHGSADDLPLGRGRSPMNWSLIEGRNNFYTNLFRYDPGVDSGDILDTFVFSIQNGDTAETMHYKNVLAMKALIIRNLEKLFSGDFVLKKQRDITPTYYPKRTPEDSLIDWNQDVFRLEAFVRAVTRPFNGSYTYLNGDKITIFRA